MNADRKKQWLPEYSRLAQVTWHTGDDVTLDNIRNFQYAADGSVTPGWYSRRFSLRDVKSVDLVLSCWASPHIAHVFLSFELGDGGRIAFSVETRRHEGQAWSAWRGFFRAYPVIYVAGDERDLIGQRLCIRQERVWLYPMSLSPAKTSSLLHSYLLRIGQINRAPERYHTLWNNCTTNILRHGKDLTPDVRYHWQLLLSGHADRYCYERGLLKDWGLQNKRGPFDVLKYISRLAPPETGGSDFSASIRLYKGRGLPS
ncbi:MAG: DUF4105 domain-containing protein [Pantoea sp.]|uniref:Lnb N-terminal periplasmic domain-containing protein n=1 Tax=Pantoea sp. TaxID=69393 RepID=UPI0039E30851